MVLAHIAIPLIILSNASLPSVADAAATSSTTATPIKQSFSRKLEEETGLKPKKGRLNGERVYCWMDVKLRDWQRAGVFLPIYATTNSFEHHGQYLNGSILAKIGHTD